MKILIVEDDPDLLSNIAKSLEKEKYLVETATNFSQGSEKINLYSYDCILLDITLPDGTGLHLLKELKELKKNDSVIIISARNSLDDKLTGLEFGADDYLTKPFHLAELNARVKAVLRRKNFKGENTIKLNNLTLDFDKHIVAVNLLPLVLNRKEFDILSFFLANKDRLVSRTSLASHVWGDYTDEAASLEFIYSQIKNLRKKLKDASAEIEIQAVYGIGYKLISTL